MASIVCPALEPRFVEQRTHGLKLATPNPHFPRTHDPQSPKSVLHRPISDSDSVDQDDNSWADIHSLSDTLQSPKQAKNPFYVHHLTKRFQPTLSSKSLEMCTERLGCETGTDITETTLTLSSSSSNSVRINSLEREILKSKQQTTTQGSPILKRVISGRKGAFPPPLTTITGKKSVVLRPQREDGRLILKAITISSKPTTYFQAERGEGRLRLRFTTNYTESFQDRAAKDEETVEEEEEEEEEEVSREKNGKSGDGEGEMGMEKFQKPSRCKDGGGCSRTNGMSIWEPFWVASA